MSKVEDSLTLELSKEEYQWILETIQEATMRDDRELTCDHCNSNQINCRASMCGRIKYKLYKLIETL